MAINQNLLLCNVRVNPFNSGWTIGIRHVSTSYATIQGFEISIEAPLETINIVFFFFSYLYNR